VLLRTARHAWKEKRRTRSARDPAAPTPGESARAAAKGLGISRNTNRGCPGLDPEMEGLHHGEAAVHALGTLLRNNEGSVSGR